MDRYTALMNRVAAGERVLMNGATGTEVERRGVPQMDNGWNGGGILSAPDIVRQVHREYLDQGAEIIISNTFATNEHILRGAGQVEAFDTFNRRGVELAIEARTEAGAHDALVAGAIAYWSFAGAPPEPEALRDSTGAQAAIMADAGADFLILEMMAERDRMLATLDGAATSGLPVWAGLSCVPDERGEMVLLHGGPLVDALTSLRDHGASVVGIMHTDVEDVPACLDILEAGWSGETYVYAHSGRMVDGAWTFDNVISPENYATCAAEWVARGIKIIGGCCGIGPAHMACVRPHVL